MKNQLLLFLMFFTASILMVSCGEDEPENKASPSTSKEIMPEVERVYSYPTQDDFTITFRVKSVNKPNVTLMYSRETGKTSSPSLNHSSSPECIRIAEVKSSGYSWYHFKATHAGFNGGNYIYYQVSASNSAGTVKSNTNYCIIKR